MSMTALTTSRWSSRSLLVLSLVGLAACAGKGDVDAVLRRGSRRTGRCAVAAAIAAACKREADADYRDRDDTPAAVHAQCSPFGRDSFIAAGLIYNR